MRYAKGNDVDMERAAEKLHSLVEQAGISGLSKDEAWTKLGSLDPGPMTTRRGTIVKKAGVTPVNRPGGETVYVLKADAMKKTETTDGDTATQTITHVLANGTVTVEDPTVSATYKHVGTVVVTINAAAGQKVGKRK